MPGPRHRRGRSEVPQGSTHGWGRCRGLGVAWRDGKAWTLLPAPPSPLCGVQPWEGACPQGVLPVLRTNTCLGAGRGLSGRLTQRLTWSHWPAVSSHHLRSSGKSPGGWSGGPGCATFPSHSHTRPITDGRVASKTPCEYPVHQRCVKQWSGTLKKTTSGEN